MHDVPGKEAILRYPSGGGLTRMRRRRKGTQEIIEALIHFEKQDIPGLAAFLSIYTGIPTPTLRGLIRRYDGKNFEDYDRYRLPYIRKKGRNKGEPLRGNLVDVWRLSWNSDAPVSCG